jgi:hypothetical protein
MLQPFLVRFIFGKHIQSWKTETRFVMRATIQLM